MCLLPFLLSLTHNHQPMKIKFLLLLCIGLISIGASAQYSFPSCWTPWTPNASGHAGGTEVSHNSGNYRARWSTITEPGTTGDWELVSKCGDGGIGPDYTGPQRIITYLPYWVPDFDYTTFDPASSTHIHIAFNLFKQNNNNFNSSDFASIAWGEFHNRKVDSILFDLDVLSRAQAKGVKVQVAIGGATDFAFLWLLTRYYNDDAKLEEMANFITNYVNAKGIDGVDLDLECWWPDAAISGTTEQGGRVRGDKWGGVDAGPHPAGLGLTRLAQKLRAKMPNKVISAAVFGTSYYGNNYDDGMAQYLDWLGLMTYDFTGSWNTSPVGPHSSLFKVPMGTYQGQTADNPIYSAQDALEYWMGLAPAAWNHDGGFNVPKAKLAIGVPLYGYDLATRKPNNANGFVALKWKEILQAYPNAAISYDPQDPRQLGGYIGADGKKIYYETPVGAAEKIEYTKQFGHQGVIVWELTGDVPLNDPNSIMKAINDAAGIEVNPPPTVSITSPANNATFASGANITINASASDDGSVTKVEFFNGQTKLGEDTSSPYSFTWSAVSSGSYALTAKATDNEGSSATSSTVNITVGNAPPVVSITSPTNGATYAAGSSITITASASDPNGSVSKVEFFRGTTKLGEDLSAPYSFQWSNVSAGSYALTAKATDNGGASTTSAVVNVTVGNGLPVTSITAPTNNASFTAPATVTISASASDADGSIAKVEFFNGTTKLGEDTSSPYTFAWSNVGEGTYSLTSRATDNLGATATSAAVSISVTTGQGSCSGVQPYVNGSSYNTGSQVVHNSKKYECKVGGWCSLGGAYEPGVGWAWGDAWTDQGSCSGGNVNPTATITSPSNNASFTAPATITISATASDSDGTISKVEFFNGTSKLGEDTSSPYSFTWSNVAAGNYTLSAKAIDNGGAVGTSASVNISVGSGNISPSTSITAPANNASFSAPASIVISATASDSDGSVSKVEFFQGTTKLGEDSSAPYSYTWSNVAAGSYTLTTRAIDNLGATGNSNSVSITVTGGGCSYPQYVENGGYVAGSIVQNAGSSYECKPHPYTGWCNGAAWAYAPGTGAYWQDAWTLVGTCSGRMQTDIAADNASDVMFDDGLALSPNPGKQRESQELTLTFQEVPSKVDVYMMDMNGSEILRVSNLKNNNGQVTVRTPALRNGLYLVRVKTEKRYWIKKYLIAD